MGKPGRKYSETEVEERILYILSLRSKGVKSTSDLFRFFSEKYPDLTKRQFEYDLRKAREKIQEYFEKDVEFEVAEIVRHYWELYNRSLKMQDYRECRAVLQEIAKIKSLAVTRVEHSGPDGGPIGKVEVVIKGAADPVTSEDDIDEDI